jgi:hypothetical protein
MDKFLFVEQPPLTPKFNFLVDGLTPNKQYGEATDIEKIEYNLNILGNEIKLETEIQTILLTKKSLATVIPIGRYITILLLTKERDVGRMVFIEFDISKDINVFKQILLEEYDTNIANEWLSVYEKYKQHYSDKDDNAELLLIEKIIKL